MYLEKDFIAQDIIMESLDLKHSIQITIIRENAFFQIIKFNPDFQKTFVMLLKDVIEKFTSNNIKYVKQNIIDEDKSYFKNSDINELEDGNFIVSTPIISFIDEMISVLGIKKL